ncbi:MAG: glycosyltransferase family 2 protein [Patescibacteria group bacterium]
MSKISAVIIAKNEEQMIEECLESLSFSDEIVVIDNNSTDKTVEIAEKFKAKIYKESSADFSILRNLGLKNAQNEWILYIDADERVDKVLSEAIKKAIETNEFGSYRLQRKNFYLGINEWPHIEKIIRLFNKENISEWFGQIHESPKVSGETGILDGFLLHFTHRDLESMVIKTISWSQTEAILRFNANHPKITWWRIPRVMLTAFISSYIFQKGYKAKTAGLIESIYQAFSIFITYAKLWEIQNKVKVKS